MILSSNTLKNSYIKFVFCVLTFIFSLNDTWAQNLVIKAQDPVNNPLIDSLVGQLVGSGVIVQNVRSNLVETSRALATFKAPQQLLGIKEGLMMVTGIADTMAQRRIEQIFVGTDASLDRLQDIVDGSMDKLGLVLDTSIDKLEGVGNSWLDKSDSIAKERLNQGDLILQRNIQAMGNQGERLSVNTFERLSKLLILALIIFLIGFVSVKTIQEKELRLQPIKIVGIAAVLALGIFFMTQDGALHSVIAVENEQIPAGINVPYPQQPEDTRLAKGSLE